jgi:hypothetical protein
VIEITTTQSYQCIVDDKNEGEKSYSGKGVLSPTAWGQNMFLYMTTVNQKVDFDSALNEHIQDRIIKFKLNAFPNAITALSAYIVTQNCHK